MKNEEPKCLSCYEPLTEGSYHGTCLRKIFGKAELPLLDLSLVEIEEIAKKEIAQRVSITGVQPKLSLDFLKEHGESRLTFVNIGGRFILKPPSKEFPYLPENEDLCMSLASICGIETAKHTLIRLQSGELSYLAVRFDRGSKGEKYELEDMCQLTENQTENKYHSSHEKIAKAINKYSSYSGIDMIRFFESIIFSFLIGNADMHLKNFSLLTKKGREIMLSPAYDLVATKLIIPDDQEELALPINGKKTKLKKADFLSFAEVHNIHPKTVQKIFQRLRSALDSCGRKIEQSFLPRDQQTRFKELIRERASRLELGNEEMV